MEVLFVLYNVQLKTVVNEVNDAIGCHLQLPGMKIPSYYLKIVPYLLTIAVLIFVGYKYRGQPTGNPETLGQPYVCEELY